MIPVVPRDALAVVRRAFAAANRAAADRMCRLPNIWETSLDQAFIDALVGQGGPVQVDSGWTVRIETHFLGGGRHWGPEWDFPHRRWEIADIGVLVMIREGSRLALTKLALFQSKRLYPTDEPIDEIELDHYRIGFGRLLEDDAVAADASRPRIFAFDEHSAYNMILNGDQQIQRIEGFERSNRTPVHYLLYNPSVLPWRQAHPLTTAPLTPEEVDVGCRVVPATSLRVLLAQLPGGASPSYSYLRSELPSPYRGAHTRAGRRVEDFIERVVTCKEGYKAQPQRDNALDYVFNRRGAPIAAAIGITISAPDSNPTERA